MFISNIYAFPAIPELIFGVNQYNIGFPENEGRDFPLKESEIKRLKEMGVNCVRVPVYPIEVGIDPDLFKLSEPGEYFDFEKANSLTPDFRSLDAFLELMEKYDITPYLSPSPEYNDMKGGSDWSSKAWLRLHVPADAEKALWFTELIAKHVGEKFGSNIIYGWFEDWYWGSYAYRGDGRMDANIKKELANIYDNDISILNEAWKSNFISFGNIELPTIFKDNQVPKEAFNNQRTYDLRFAIDNLQKQKLSEIKEIVKEISPDSMWAGGCMCNEFGGLLDINANKPTKTKLSLRSYAEINDILTADTYAPPRDYKVYYRTLAKIANLYGKKLMVAEISAVNPEGFEALAEVGGPIGGCLAWVGKENLFGFFKEDGTERTENLLAYGELYKKLQNNKTYIKGDVLVYLPLETLEYTIGTMNHMDSFYYICNNLSAKELEPIFTDELASLQKNANVFSLEKQMPKTAIEIFNSGNIKLVSPHKTLLDENGNEYENKNYKKDFWTYINSVPKGEKLTESFKRVIEKEFTLSYKFNGSKAFTSSKLHATNVVISGRANDVNNLIASSIYDGVTFADEVQQEIVDIELAKEEVINSAFVDFFEGDLASQIPGSRMPEEIKIWVSDNNNDWIELKISIKNDYPRIRFSFDNVKAKFVRFDFGENVLSTPASGLRMVELGVWHEAEL